MTLLPSNFHLSLEKMINTLKQFASFYNSSFRSRPTATLAVTNGFLSGVADVVAQSAQIIMVEEGGMQVAYDPVRSLRFVAFGIGMGPIIGRWNNVLERNFPLRPSSKAAKSLLSPISPRPASSSTAASEKLGQLTVVQDNVSFLALGKRVLADQAVMAPIGLVLFIASMGIMEAKSSDSIQDKFKTMYVPAILANWTVWPFIQVVNFRYMPLAYRVPFQSSCGVLWTLYLSLLNSEKGEVAAEEFGGA
ncbi:hypothetical protein BDY24DRAFT_384720, partial [Mrakia frigida]|uniref:Mpv17/PMP22 family protein n=1 Tax=Mrakia frigida TaxID=29902 RepID=UPI003FCC0141